MLRDIPYKHYQTIRMNGVSIKSFRTNEETKVNIHTFDYVICVSRRQLGDYGYFSELGSFCCEGNIFANIESPSLSSEVDNPLREHQVTDARHSRRFRIVSAQLLPTNHSFNSSLASLSSQLINAYLVTMILRCVPNSVSACIHTLRLVSDGQISFQI